MHRATITGNWECEPIFASSGSKKPDGSYCAYFSHVFYKGEQVGTVRAEELGEGSWEAMVENAEGETVHVMGCTYPTYREAIDDMTHWFAGQ